tara:strand:+ start:1026 stop:1322 length:297 start_codon:yes stop_codon:yes gene_type:complete
MAEYNGWSNYETWAYHLWLVDSNVNAYGKYKDIHTTYLLSKVLKEEAEEVFYDMLEEAGIAGWMHDICGSAFSKIDFYEIADVILKYNEKEKEQENAS